MYCCRWIALVLLGILLAACEDNDDNTDTMPEQVQTRSYSIEITNLTRGQPLSPVAAISHNGVYELFAVGMPASESLELLAEGGDNSELLGQAAERVDVRATVSGSGPVPPGGSDILMMEVSDTEERLDALHLDLVTMLVNTNDAIAAIQNQFLGNLAEGESASVMALSYDAGTEANSESADHIPGPAANGGAQEGFNPNRDDLDDRVHQHPGVLSLDHGMSDSILTQMHRWDNPVMQVVVTRMQ